MKARLHPRWVGGRAGYLYSVIFEGNLIVDRSRDPECDAARALVAMGRTGKLTLLDGKTGLPRTIINIEKVAKLRTAEPNRGVVHLQKWAPFSLVSAPSPVAGEEAA
jgi:hypothetical protein